MPQKKKEAAVKKAPNKKGSTKKSTVLNPAVAKKTAPKTIKAAKNQKTSSPKQTATKSLHPQPENVIPAVASFGRSRVVLILRDNQWAFAYWEIGGENFKAIKDVITSKNREIANIALRVVADDASSFFDISLNKFASSWYFQPNMPGKNIFVELMIVDTDGDYYKLSTSNSLAIPGNPAFSQSQGESPVKWRDASGADKSEGIPFDEKSYSIFIESLGGEKIIKERVGSDEFLTHLKDKLFSGELISSHVLSSLISSGISSLTSSAVSSGESINNIKSAKPTTGENDDGFWLVAGTELILYGATEPDADLYVSNKKIELKDDGSFMLRMPLPDGDIELPVEAYSKNRKHYRKITPKVKKWTE